MAIAYMSYTDYDNYVDPHYSGVAQSIRERSKIPIALLPSSTKKLPPACPICHVHYISQENDTIYFCPSCGTKIMTTEIKQDTKVTALYAPLSRSNNKILISQKQEQRRKKTLIDTKIDSTLDLEGEMNAKEIAEEIGVEPSQTVSASYL